MKTLISQDQPSEVARPSFAANERHALRISERELAGIPAWWVPGESSSPRHPSLRQAVSLWDYSFDGFAFTLPLASQKTTLRSQSPHLHQLGHLELSLAGITHRFACRVQNTVEHRGRLRVGLRRQGFTLSPLDASTLRLPEGKSIHGETPNPLLYGLWTKVRLIGIGQGLRLVFVCEDGTLLANLGQELTIAIVLPTSGEHTFRGRVCRINCLVELEGSEGIHGTDGTHRAGANLQVGLEPIGLSAALANDLGEYLVSECGMVPDTLRALGFPLRFFRQRATMAFVDSMEMYQDVLNLRRTAYVAAKKRAEGTPMEALSSKWDRHSRILCLYHDKNLVASATLTFPDSNDDKLRSEAAFPGGIYPCPMPKKSDFIEVSGLCTHHDYRKGDLLQLVFHHIARLLILSDRRYIVTLADSSLVNLYRKIGFRLCDGECTFLGIKHYLIFADKRCMITSRGMSWLTWHSIYGEMFHELDRLGFMPLTGLDRLRVKARLASRPLAEWLKQGMLENQFQRTLKKFTNSRNVP